MTSHAAVIPEPAEAEELFIGFANTLTLDRGEPVDSLPDVAALLDWLRERRLLSARGFAAEASRLRHDEAEGARRLERYRHLRSVLHAIAAETTETGQLSTESLRSLNHILRHGLHYHQLDRDGTRYALAQVGDRLDQARATIASSLAQFLARDIPGRLRTCANPGCRFLFIDHSPTGRRRWCDMRTCGNQAKVARHRARARRATRAAPVSRTAAGSASRGVPSATGAI